MCVYQYRYWLKHMQWNNEEVLLQGSRIVSLILVPIMVGIKVFYVKCNAAKKGQETSKWKNCNLEREYRDCIKSRRDKIGITRHIILQCL